MPDRDLSHSAPVEEWLAEAFAQRLAEALELMTGEAPQVAWRAADPGELPSDLRWWAQPLKFGDSAPLWIGAAEATRLGIGRYILRAAGIGDSDPSEATNTYLEILGQALSGLARDIGTRLRQEVTLELGSEEAPPAGAWLAVVDVTMAVDQPLSLWFAPSGELIERLRTEPTAGAKDSPSHEAEAATGGPSASVPVPAAEASAAPNPRTLELLMEVEMPVSVSFGRAQLPLKDVLKLTTGSIIELNRTVDEPVEIIVNNCVIARGEVVVVEGNYGVRIQQIVSRQERLRTLK